MVVPSHLVLNLSSASRRQGGSLSATFFRLELRVDARLMDSGDEDGGCPPVVARPFDPENVRPDAQIRQKNWCFANRPSIEQHGRTGWLRFDREVSYELLADNPVFR